jgi:hypothetical protein
VRVVVVFAVLAVVVPSAGAATQDTPARLPVVVVEGLELDDLERLAGRGAVGLLVPGAGPETSASLARAAVERAEARNSLYGGLPEGPVRIRVEEASTVPDGPAIVLGLPRGGPQSNDRRYPIAVLAPGYDGLLTSPSTRIAGLVSVVDVAPTARGQEGALSSTSAAAAVAELRDLDTRIRDNGRARQPASIAAAVLVILLGLLGLRGLVSAHAAVVGVAAALLCSLLLGATGISEPLVTVPLVAGSVVLGVTAGRLSCTAVGWLLAATVAAYLVAMALDDRWVALSPLGPSQNARFYGLSNLLETMLLVPALAAAAILGRRFGPAAFVAVALGSLVAVAGSRFGADGGGAIVFAAGFAVLGALLVGGGRRAVALAAAGAAAVVLLLAADAALGPATHVGETVRGGPVELAEDLADRVSLSWRRATARAQDALVVFAGVALLAFLAARLRRLPREQAALPLAFAAAIAVSLVVNDSPVDVTIWGLAGLLAVSALSSRPDEPRTASRSTRGTRRP